MVERGKIGGTQRYDLHLARRDGGRIHRKPHPVTETFNLDDDREVAETVGKHFVAMAAHAEEKHVAPYTRVSKLKWLGEYQIEIWRSSGHSTSPDLISMSTHGWLD